ncbi:MAG: FAD-binding protein [Acidobacteria bacterium]|nr:FAD-binding protein [Acidobacteriota bacterium]
MTTVPQVSEPESTTTVVIGSGFSGLAVASELSRQGVQTIVLDGLEASPSLNRSPAHSESAWGQRGEILRLLRHYALSHQLDIRERTKPMQLVRGTVGVKGAWAVHTADGVVMADNIVLTQCAENHFRRILASLGLALGKDAVRAMRSLGIYLVGVGGALTPSTQEIMRQAKVVSHAISSTTAAA